MTYPHNIRKIDIQGQVDTDLENALRIFDMSWGKRPEEVTHFIKTESKTLIFLRYFEDEVININAQELFVPSKPSGLTAFLTLYFEYLEFDPKFKEICPVPDTDGSVGLGFRLYNDDWETVAGFEKSIFAIEPAWLVYGK